MSEAGIAAAGALRKTDRLRTGAGAAICRKGVLRSVVCLSEPDRLRTGADAAICRKEYCEAADKGNPRA